MSAADPISDLLDHLDRLRGQGRTIVRATLEELCKEHPDLLPRLIRRHQQAELIRHWSRERAAPASAPACVAGRYVPGRLLGRGGLGEVYEARDEKLGRSVALKRMVCRGAGPSLTPDELWQAHPELRSLSVSSETDSDCPADLREELALQIAALEYWDERMEPDADVRELFVREARHTSQLQHPGIVPVYDLLEEQEPWYTMRPIVEGKSQTLKAQIDDYHACRLAGQDGGDGALAFQKLLRSFLSVCDAIAYAHSRGVIHRDLKPENIMVGDYGETLVLDWGLSKRFGDAVADDPGAARFSASEATARDRGSPGYMSPEQADGRGDVGPLSDVYSLGATLYTILAGRPALLDDRPGREFRGVGDLAPPRRHNPKVPPALEAVCLKAMRARPEERYCGAGELAHDIEQWLADEPVGAWREPWTVRGRRWLKQHRTAVASLLVGVLMALIGLAAVTALLAQRNRDLVDFNRELTAAKQTADRNRQAAEYSAGVADAKRRAILDFANTTRALARGQVQKRTTISQGVAAYRTCVEILSLAHDQDPGDQDVREQLAETLSNLAWAELLDGDYPEIALAHAVSANSHAPERPEILLNLAHAYLFSVDDPSSLAEAKKIYEQNRKKLLPDEKVFGRQALDDFQRFGEWKLTNPVVDERIRVVVDVLAAP